MKKPFKTSRLSAFARESLFSPSRLSAFARESLFPPSRLSAFARIKPRFKLLPVLSLLLITNYVSTCTTKKVVTQKTAEAYETVINEQQQYIAALDSLLSIDTTAATVLYNKRDSIKKIIETNETHLVNDTADINNMLRWIRQRIK